MEDTGLRNDYIDVKEREEMSSAYFSFSSLSGEENKDRGEAVPLFSRPLGTLLLPLFLFKAPRSTNNLFWKFFPFLHSSTRATS